MKSVQCLITQKGGSQREECRLFLVGDVIVADQPDSSAAKFILDRKIVGPDGWLDSSAGAVFLAHLAANYNGRYFQCSRYKEGWVRDTHSPTTEDT